MTRDTLLVFDREAARWTIFHEGLELSSPLHAVADDIEIGRDDTGRVVEMVIDLDPTTLRASDLALGMVRDAFGSDAVAIVAGASTDDDLEVRLVRGATSPVPVSSLGASMALEGEPGIPSPGPGGMVVLVAPGRRVSVRAGDHRLTVEVPTDLGPGDWWIRVSEADSGLLLALGRVRPGSTGPTVVPMALSRDLTNLHIVLSTTPLDDVGHRTERRERWADGLLADARASLRRRPRRSIRQAVTARRVAEAIGDDGRVREARDVEAAARRAWRRWMALGGGFALALAGVVGVLVGIAVGRTASGDTSGAGVPTPDTIMTPESPGSTEPLGSSGPDPVPDPTPSVGPAVHTFDDGVSVRLFLIGSSSVQAGDTVTLSVDATDLGWMSFGGTTPDDALANCRSAVDTIIPPGGSSGLGPAPSSWYLTLEPLPDPSVGAIGLPPLLVDSEPLTLSSVVEDCAEAVPSGAGSGPSAFIVTARVLVTRATTSVEVTVPREAEPGVWEVAIGNGTVRARTEPSPVRLRIVP